MRDPDRRRRREIVRAIEAIEADPAPCLPDPTCNCETCSRYCELFAALDKMEEKADARP